MKKTFLLSSILSFLVLSLFGQIPAGYYDSAIGKKQAELKTALHLKIKTANVPSYGSGSGSTWAAFAHTDVRPTDGTVWDMYSTNHVAFNGNSAASGMNIEHSFAKSWWGDGRQAAQDVHHLNPSNSTANSAKGSWPMAVVDDSTTFSNGVIKVGKSSSRPGGVIDAWEPADEYKGDFSRAYMYMVTAYEDYATLWTGNSVNQLDNNTYPVFEQWTVDLLLKWCAQDPISQKEITRNNEVYKIQGNRNPYIDYPLMGEYVWGKLTNVPFTTDGTVDYPYLSTPSAGAIFDFGKVVYPQAAALTVNLKAHNLTGDLSISITGTNAANFLVVNSTISKADAEAGYLIPVNYSAQTMGAKTAQLNISGGGITATSVTLKALSTDEFLALPTSDITQNGFTANWTVSSTAIGYNLNVYSLQNNGATESITLLQEEFLSGLPVGWTSEGYTDNQTSGSMRLASGSNPGKIIFPTLNLSTSGTVLTVKARQYVNDAGAQLTATLNNQPLAVWNTGIDNQDFTVSIPQNTSSSVIALSAVAGKRVYVDYVKVASQGAAQTPVSISGFPKSVGNVLTYTVNGLVNDSAYYYTITPVGNSASVSNAISVRTSLVNNLGENEFQHIRYSVSSEGIRVSNLKTNSKLNLLDCMGRKIKTYISNSTEMVIQVDQKGLYLLQIEQDNRFKTYKIQN